MKIKDFFTKIKWLFSFKKQRELKDLQKECMRICRPLWEETLNKIIPDNPLNFNKPMEFVEVKCNDYFVKAEGAI